MRGTVADRAVLVALGARRSRVGRRGGLVLRLVEGRRAATDRVNPRLFTRVTMALFKYARVVIGGLVPVAAVQSEKFKEEKKKGESKHAFRREGVSVRSAVR